MAGNIIWPITHEADEFENGSSSSKKKTCTQWVNIIEKVNKGLYPIDTQKKSRFYTKFTTW